LITQRAGFDPARFWLHKFRARYAVSHLRAGVDVDTLRKWLGHKNTVSLRAYLLHTNNEKAVESGKVSAGYTALRPAGGTAVPPNVPSRPATAGSLPQFWAPELGWE